MKKIGLYLLKAFILFWMLFLIIALSWNAYWFFVNKEWGNKAVHAIVFFMLCIGIDETIVDFKKHFLTKGK